MRIRRRLMLVTLTALCACGSDDGLSGEQKSYNDYLDIMQGDGSGQIRSGSLRAEGVELLTSFNATIAQWNDDQIDNSTFDRRLEEWVAEVEAYQREVQGVAAVGDLRAIHNIYLQAWARYESAARSLRLFLFDADNTSLLTTYSDQLNDGTALLRDYVAQLESYREIIN